VNEISQVGQKIKIETLPSNYKPVSGVLMPHTIRTWSTAGAGRGHVIRSDRDPT
jgi:hypothetical protein